MKILKVIGLGLLGYAVASVIVSVATNNNEPTPQAKNNTYRNAFISGCEREASAYPTIDVDYYCGCGYDELLVMYPDFNTNEERINRIITEGYNSAETDVLASCYREKI